MMNSENTNQYLEDGGKVETLKAAPTEGRPVVVLIGDSIREGYCGFVRETLEPEVEVYYPNENCRFSQYILCTDFYGGIQRPENVRVVHWNCGHWDVARFDDVAPLNTKEVYAETVGRIQTMLKKRFPNAEIIFATTTPMNPNGEKEKAGRRSTEDIRAYNAAALEVLSGMNVTVNDLYGKGAGLGEELYRDHCHYTEAGNRYLADCVCECVRKYI